MPKKKSARKEFKEKVTEKEKVRDNTNKLPEEEASMDEPTNIKKRKNKGKSKKKKSKKKEN